MASYLQASDTVLEGLPVTQGSQITAKNERPSPVVGANEDVYRNMLLPDDSYTPDGTYWADLPLAKRVAFINKTNNAEASKELGQIGAMMKKDPLSPLGWYWRHAILPGAGLGLEGYLLFSIGNLHPLFSAVWPQCWGSKATVCNKNSIAAVTYLEIFGIMLGQMVVGVVGDWLGRRWMLIQDALIMFLGAVMLTASWGANLQGWVACYTIALFIFSFGVGGEYPATATAAMEKSLDENHHQSTRDDRLHRGRKVTLAFLMQGWGQFINQLLLIVLLLIFNRTGDPPYGKTAAQLTFRISLGLPAVGLLWLAYYRTWKMPRPIKPQAFSVDERNMSASEIAAAKKKQHVTGYDIKSLKMTFSLFGGRLIASAGTWFCNDVFFYGNKLFQGQFINVIASNPSSILVTWKWNLINVAVSMIGYYLASILIDNKLYGRNMMQQIGFLMCFICFVIPGFNYKYYTSPAHIKEFQAMYFLSSFFNQFGPNAVTFLVAGEAFPTSVRATAHGFAACIGKSGALVASILYAYIDTQTRFYVVPWFGLLGMLLTWAFQPDVTGLDLAEQERRWRFIAAGRAHEYHGVAINPRHLSRWERWRGVGKNYNPQLDYEQKVEEMRMQIESERLTSNMPNGSDAEKGHKPKVEGAL